MTSLRERPAIFLTAPRDELVCAGPVGRLRPAMARGHDSLLGAFCNSRLIIVPTPIAGACTKGH